MIRVLLAEDHLIVRQGLCALLEREPDVEVVGEAGGGREALAQVSTFHPDVLVVDVTLPELDGLEVTRRVREHHVETQVVVLSMHNNDAYVARAVRHGALAYVLKESSVDDLVTAVRTVFDGERFFSAGLAAKAGGIDAHPPATDRYETLSEREREVLHLVAEGHTSPEIAARLFISPRTVETHRSNLMAKLGLHTLTDLVHYALRRGLVPLGPRDDGARNAPDET